jgi:C4-type Zn-finger protein
MSFDSDELLNFLKLYKEGEFPNVVLADPSASQKRRYIEYKHKLLKEHEKKLTIIFNDDLRNSRIDENINEIIKNFY